MVLSNTEETPLVAKEDVEEGTSLTTHVKRATVACVVVLVVGLAYDQYNRYNANLGGGTVDPSTVCNSGKFTFMSGRAAALCSDQVDGVDCRVGLDKANNWEVFTVVKTKVGWVLKGSRQGKYCQQVAATKAVKCDYDEDQLTSDLAPVGMTKMDGAAGQGSSKFTFRFGSSGFCNDKGDGALLCTSSWARNWEEFMVNCAE